MAENQSYNDWLKQNFGEIIDALGLDEMQKHFLRSRWLDQMIWTEGKAGSSQHYNRILRLTIIVGGVLVPPW